MSRDIICINNYELELSSQFLLEKICKVWNLAFLVCSTGFLHQSSISNFSPDFENFPIVRFGSNFLHRFILGWHLCLLHFFFGIPLPPKFEHFLIVWFGWNLLHRFNLGWRLWRLHFFLIPSPLWLHSLHFEHNSLSNFGESCYIEVRLLGIFLVKFIHLLSMCGENSPEKCLIYSFVVCWRLALEILK